MKSNFDFLNTDLKKLFLKAEILMNSSVLGFFFKIYATINLLGGIRTMFDMAEVLERELLELRKIKVVTEEMKDKIKKDLIRAGILNKNGKLRKLPIR